MHGVVGHGCQQIASRAVTQHARLRVHRLGHKSPLTTIAVSIPAAPVQTRAPPSTTCLQCYLPAAGRSSPITRHRMFPLDLALLSLMHGQRRTLCHMRSLSATATNTQRPYLLGTGAHPHLELSNSSALLAQPTSPPSFINSSKRHLATVSDYMSVHRSKYAAVVVGAGPAGICAVGNMLERKVGPILWVDDEFNAGRINKSYREVPSNTKTKLFIDFAEALTSFRKILEKTPSPNAIDHLRELPQDRGTVLGNGADMLVMLTRGLMNTPGVEVRKGRVTSASVDSHKGWTVRVSLAGHDSPMPSGQSTTVISDRVILCTGSSPTEGELPVKVPHLREIHLDTALSPSQISDFIPKDKPVTIAVIGASHSAILVLWNLSNLALSTHPKLHIKWFTRHSLRYAEFMDGWILRDNTGLKGDAAAWARENLEPEVFPNSRISKCITPVTYEKGNEVAAYKEHLPSADYCVQAIGYTRDPLPDLKRGVGTLEPKYNHLTGGFEDGKGEKVPGLFGAGIAWPERVTDPHGNVEYAVGFFKFMKYLKRVSCDWN